MRKFITFLLTIVLAAFFGFWVSEQNVLDETRAGELLTNLSQKIPAPNFWDSQSNHIIETDDLTTAAFQEKLNQTEPSSQSASSEHPAVDYVLVEETIFDLLNELRKEVGVSPLQKNDVLKRAADTRAVETEHLFSHTRPDGRDTFTVLQEPDHTYNYRLAGENLGMATYFKSEKRMAEFLFNGWVESPGHYENMIKPEFEEVGIGVHYDGEVLYATQLFGTPF